MAPNERTTTQLNLIAKILKETEIIDDKFNGQVTFHFCDGGIAEIDKLEKNLRRKLKGI